MPRTANPRSQRSMWSGLGDGFNYMADLIAATAVWAGIGYGLDRWLGTWPVLFAIGAVIGNATGIYLLYRRTIPGARTGSDPKRDE